MRRGERTRAGRILRSALGLSWRGGVRPTAQRCMERLAELETDPARRDRLRGAAQATGASVEPVDSPAFREGAALAPDDAVAFALRAGGPA